MFLFYTNPILIAAAVLPAIFLLVHVYRADKLEKEPAPPPDVAFRRVQLPV